MNPFPNTCLSGESRFVLQGADIQALEVLLAPGETILAQPGAFLFGTESVSGLTIHLGRRLTSLLFRRWSGESYALQRIRAGEAPAWVGLRSDRAGPIVHVPLPGDRTIYARRGAFLAAVGDVSVSLAAPRSLSSALFGGHGWLYQRLSGRGDVFMAARGQVLHRALDAGRILRLSTHHLLAFDASVGQGVQMTGSLGAMLFSGEGAFMTVAEGPGELWVETAPRELSQRRRADRIPSGTETGPPAEVAR